MMDTIVHWATILSPIIAVVIAILTSRSSAKATAKQVAALEESTKKQVESIKKLARIQVELTTMQIQKELGEARTHYLHASEKNMDAMGNRLYEAGISYSDTIARIHEREEKEKNLHLEKDFYSKRVSWLNNNLNRVEAIKKELEKG